MIWVFWVIGLAVIAVTALAATGALGSLSDEDETAGPPVFSAAELRSRHIPLSLFGYRKDVVDRLLDDAAILIEQNNNDSSAH